MMPKEDLLKHLTEQANGPETKTTVAKAEVTGTQGPVVHGADQYAKVDYRLTINITTTEGKKDDGTPFTKEEQSEADEFTLELMKAAYGDKKVLFDEPTRTFTIEQNDSMFAIHEASIGEWRFMADKAGAEKMIKAAVPEKVLKGFKWKR